MQKLLLLLCSTILISFTPAMWAQSRADLIAINGKIWTEDPKRPEVEAIAVRDHRILAAGSSAAMRQLADPETRVIDLKGRRVVPGFNDAHVHFFWGGQGLASVQLRDATSEAEFRKRIADFARTRPKGEWILDGNWDHEKWTPARLPTHELIDDVTPDNPVWVNRSDGHMMLANALAMKLAGITRETKDVPGGVIVRDKDGNPTGIFKDAAKDLVEHVMPPPSNEQVDAAILAAQQYALENGVTSVQDMGFTGSKAADMQALIVRGYQRLLEENKLKVRVSARFPLSKYQRLADLGVMTNFGNDRLVIGSVKAFADGSLGSTTAWFFQPFDDAPETSGVPSDELRNPDQMYANMVGADRAGLHIATHAIGDRANKTILDLYERLEKEDGEADRRLRIEHAQHLRPEDIPRFAQLHVIASVQPYHCIDDGRWAEKRIGHQRSLTTYAFRSLLDAGTTLAFGSDWFVAPIDPMAGIYAATTRRTLDGKHPDGWIPEQKISVQQAVHAYTVGSAYAESQEKDKGSLEVGKLADFTMLSDDIFHLDPVKIEDVKVEMTVSGGEIVYERGQTTAVSTDK
ncbi:MAG TPA: amidohydrolase [Alloacidobacterium sp.]|nr:amidohydrolase [Alloacidobacterium sp.]